MSTATASFFLAALALCCLAGVVVVAAVALWWRLADGNLPGWLLDLRDDVGRAALWLAWLVAATAMGGSLYYSNVVGYTPCTLCWYQRICMYPLALILLIAAVRRDVDVRWYALPLAAIGICISTYHKYIQAYPPESGTAFCTLEAPCTSQYVREFSFVSIPVMAWCGFAFVIAMLLVADQGPVLESEVDPDREDAVALGG